VAELLNALFCESRAWWFKSRHGHFYCLQMKETDWGASMAKLVACLLAQPFILDAYCEPIVCGYLLPCAEW
jgi:hypothetical protein